MRAHTLTNKSLFLLILITSFLLSATLLFGKIDPDFFSFYYIGKGMMHGEHMYRDFADNKGPIFYSIAAGTYAIFRDNYHLAIVVLSTLLDTIALYALLKTIQHVFKFSFRQNWKSIPLIILSILFYKSFSIGTYLGGVYSTSAQMAFLSLAVWAQVKNKTIHSGILFALSVWTRLSAIIFLPFFFIIIMKDKKQFSSLVPFVFGSAITTICILLPFIFDGSIKDLQYNLFTFNLSGYVVEESRRWITLLYIIAAETRIFFTLVYTSLILLFVLVQKKQSLKYLLIVLYLCSLIATFPKGIFSYHHFLQFMIAAFFLFGFAIKNLPRQMTYVIVTFITLFTISNYVLFPLSATNDEKATRLHAEVTKKKFLMVYPYYPKYYFKFNKSAPDRYFQGFFLKKGHSTLAEIDIARHKTLSKDKVKQTLFVIIKDPDTKKENEYIQTFGKTFQLQKVSTVTDAGRIMDIYVSSIR